MSDSDLELWSDNSVALEIARQADAEERSDGADDDSEAEWAEGRTDNRARAKESQKDEVEEDSDASGVDEEDEGQYMCVRYANCERERDVEFLCYIGYRERYARMLVGGWDNDMGIKAYVGCRCDCHTYFIMPQNLRVVRDMGAARGTNRVKLLLKCGKFLWPLILRLDTLTGVGAFIWRASKPLVGQCSMLHASGDAVSGRLDIMYDAFVRNNWRSVRRANMYAYRRYLTAQIMIDDSSSGEESVDSVVNVSEVDSASGGSNVMCEGLVESSSDDESTASSESEA